MAGFHQELALRLRADNAASAGLNKVRQDIDGITDSARGAKGASDQLNKAFVDATKATDKFVDAGNELIVPLKAISDAEKQLVKQTEETVSALGQINKGADSAADALRNLSQAFATGSGADSMRGGIEGIALSALRARQASNQMSEAFAQAQKVTQGFGQATNGLLVPLHRVAEVERAVAKQTQETSQTVRQADDSFQQLAQAAGAAGALHLMQRGFSAGAGIFVEFGKTARQAALISDDLTGALERQAIMATGAFQGPQTLTEAYRELGSTGAQALDILKGAPAVFNLAEGAIISQGEAAEGIVSGLNSFGIAFSEANRVSDAFVESLNRTTLGGRDLTFMLASVGPVAKLANQGLGETISAVAALRNAGAQAQDAATSVRSALLHLVDPTEESAALMKQLGIEVFDAEGRMKSWSGIVAEFERGLDGYNDKTRNAALTTIFGSDGIRAMAASMQQGSGQLKVLASQLENAEGAAARMARSMEETLDAQIRRVNGNLQRSAIVIGQDVQPAFTSLLSFIGKLAEGFVHLDDGTRKAVEAVIGGAGLVVALSSASQILRVLSPGLTGFVAVLGRIGPLATTTATGMTALTSSLGGFLGILGIVTGALTLAYGAWSSYQAAQDQAALRGADTAQTLQDQAERVGELRSELEQLQSRTAPTADEQARLRQITGELVKLAPEAATGINQMSGAVEDMGAVLMGTNTAMNRLLEQSQLLAAGAIAVAEERLPDLKRQREELQAEIKALLDPATTREALQRRGEASAVFDRLGLDFSLSFVTDPEERARILREAAAERLPEILEEARAVESEIATLEERLATAQRATGRNALQDDADAERRLQRLAQRTPRPTTPNGKDLDIGAGPAKFLDQFGIALEKTLSALAPYETALDDIGGHLDILQAKEALYIDMLAKGEAGAEAATGAEAARAQILTTLRERQEALHSANDANRAMLSTLTAEQSKLDGALGRGEISTTDYAKASKKLSDELGSLRKEISSNSVEWFRSEQAINSMESAADRASEAIRAAQKRLADKAFEQAESTMRHDVIMRRLSTQQQIELLRQMLREMELSTEQTWQLQERIVGLYGRRIQEEADRIRSAYDDATDAIADNLQSSLDALESRLKATLAPLKAELEALEAKDRAQDRERAEAEHSRKIADLQAKRRYHELRSGLEHSDAIRDIDRQLADEQRRMIEQREDWNRDDRRRNIEEKIKDAEEGAKDEREKLQDSAKEQRKALQRHYEQVQEITKGGILEVLSILAATDPKWFDTGKSFIDQLIDGLKTGDFSAIMSRIDALRTAAEQAKITVSDIGGGTATGGGNRPGTGGGGSTSALAEMLQRGDMNGAIRHLMESGQMTLRQAQAIVEDWTGQRLSTSRAQDIGARGLVPNEQRMATATMQQVMPAITAPLAVIGIMQDVVKAALGQAMQIAVAQAQKQTPAITVYGAQNVQVEDAADIDLLARAAGREVARRLR